MDVDIYFRFFSNSIGEEPYLLKIVCKKINVLNIENILF